MKWTVVILVFYAQLLNTFSEMQLPNCPRNLFNEDICEKQFLYIIILKRVLTSEELISRKIHYFVDRG